MDRESTKRSPRPGPFHETIREIMMTPMRMNIPWKSASMIEGLGVEEFNMSALSVILGAVKCTCTRTRLQDKGANRPCSFSFMPRTVFYQKLKKIPTVWCAVFHAYGSSVDDFLATFRKDNCAITDFLGCCNRLSIGLSIGR